MWKSNNKNMQCYPERRNTNVMGHCKQTCKLFPDIFWPQCNTNPNATFKICPRKYKAIDIVGPASNRSITPSLRINQSTHFLEYRYFQNWTCQSKVKGMNENKGRMINTVPNRCTSARLTDQLLWAYNKHNVRNEKQSEFWKEIGKCFQQNSYKISSGWMHEYGT